MKPAMFHDMTNVLGAPADWDPAKDGECGGLPVAIDQEKRTFTSCWVLEPDEIAAIVAGGRVYLTVFSAMHPPVAMTVRTG